MVAAPSVESSSRIPRAAASSERWELYRLLGEPVRLRLLALAAQEELAVGELADLLGEGQPNVSRHAAPLRQAGLLVVRKEGTRALIRLAENAGNDPVVADALAAGRALCVEDGSLRRIHEVVRARDAASRAFFARDGRDEKADELSPFPVELGAYLSALAPLIPHRRLAVDAGTGDGGLLEVIARVFDRVVAFDREDAQLARCAARVAQRGFDNVELARGEVGSDDVIELVRARGLADVVFATRLLHHAPKPAAAVKALSQLAKPGGAIVVVDYASHDDESMRDQADLWLGFAEPELLRFARDAGLVDPVVRGLAPLSAHSKSHGRVSRSPDAHLPWQVMVARRLQTQPNHCSRTHPNRVLHGDEHERSRNQPEALGSRQHHPLGRVAELQGGRHHARRMGSQRDPHRRERDAGAHGTPQGVRHHEAAQGRARCRLSPHDDPDRRPHRDAHRARRRGHLDVVQHLLDAGPCRRRHRGHRRPRLRLEGHDRAGVRLVPRAADQGIQGRKRPEHDPRRRW